MNDFIPVSAPAFLGREAEYVSECMSTTWISSIGRFIEEFEQSFASFVGTQHAISCMNGTVALHLALLGLDIGPGDEVLVPSLTYIASANSIRYCGAKPVFVDSDLTSWNLDPADVRRKITSRTKAIMAVHLYGSPAPMAALREIAREAGVPIVEDAAEATGALVDGKPIGSLGDIAAFSFFGNKIITCGEGGMVVTDDPQLARKIRQLKGQGQDFERRYWFPVIGYNYRMTNIQAAIGLGQLEQIEKHLAARDQIAAWYTDQLAECAELQLASTVLGRRDVCWLFSVVLPNRPASLRDGVMKALRSEGIDSRPFFYPCHTLPPYFTPEPAGCERAEWLGDRGLSLPTWVGITEQQVTRVCDALKQALKSTWVD